MIRSNTIETLSTGWRIQRGSPSANVELDTGIAVKLHTYLLYTMVPRIHVVPPPGVWASYWFLRHPCAMTGMSRPVPRSRINQQDSHQGLMRASVFSLSHQLLLTTALTTVLRLPGVSRFLTYGQVGSVSRFARRQEAPLRSRRCRTMSIPRAPVPASRPAASRRDASAAAMRCSQVWRSPSFLPVMLNCLLRMTE